MAVDTLEPAAINLGADRNTPKDEVKNADPNRPKPEERKKEEAKANTLSASVASASPESYSSLIAAAQQLKSSSEDPQIKAAADLIIAAIIDKINQLDGAKPKGGKLGAEAKGKTGRGGAGGNGSAAANSDNPILNKLVKSIIAADKLSNTGFISFPAAFSRELGKNNIRLSDRDFTRLVEEHDIAKGASLSERSRNADITNKMLEDRRKSEQPGTDRSASKAQVKPEGDINPQQVLWAQLEKDRREKAEKQQKQLDFSPS